MMKIETNVKNNLVTMEKFLYHIQFDEYFSVPHYSNNNPNRTRYEVNMSQIDFWINSLNLEIDNDFSKDGDRFKSKLRYHLKKLGWAPSKIKGRWVKTVFN